MIGRAALPPGRSLAVAAVAALAVAVVLVRLAAASGGYFPAPRLQAGAACFAVLAVLLALPAPRWTLSRPAWLAVGSLALLTAWTGISTRWSSTPDVALDDFQRDLLYLGVLGLGLLVAGSGRFSRHLVWLVLAIAAGVCVAALVGRLYPSGPPGPVDRAAQYRLGGTLGYWNALGALGALTVVLAVGLAADLRAHPVMRALAAAITVPAATAAYLSFSRGAWLSFFAGLLLLVVLMPKRFSLALALAICGGAIALVLLRLQRFDALTGAPMLGRGREVEGRAFAPFVAGLALAAGAIQGTVAALRPHPEAVERLSFLGRRATAAVGIVVASVAIVLYATHTDRAEGEAASRLLSADGWVSRQWSDFMNPATFSTSGSQRLTSARGTRSDLFRVAIDGFQAHPLRGDGSGGFEVRFAHDRRVPETVRDAHSLYLESIGELGIVGGIGVLGLVGGFIWAAVLARARPRAMGRSTAAAASAALGVWVVHCAIDWDWQMPALTGLALLLAAALTPAGISRRRRSSQDPAL